tara:strand:- start:222 stop:890 length:669 start_codon:yes stop_codon:yes gene_type:complete
MPVTINGDGSITGLSVGGLPDGSVDTDTLASNAVTSTKLHNDAVTGGHMPTGSVIQTVQNFAGGKTVTTTTAHGDAIQCPASVSITPTSASNKILIMFHGSWMFGNENDAGFWLLRNGSVIGNSTRTTENNVAFAVSGQYNPYDYQPNCIAFHYLDDAQNTSAHTYTVKAGGIQGVKAGSDRSLPKLAQSQNQKWTWGGSEATSGTESNAGNMVIIAQEIAG